MTTPVQQWKTHLIGHFILSQGFIGFSAQRFTGILQFCGIFTVFFRSFSGFLYMTSDWTFQPEAIEDTILRWLWRIAAPILLAVGSIGNAMALLVLAVTPAFRGRRGGAVAFALSALCCVDIGLLVTSLLRRCMLHWMWLYPSCDVVFLLFCSEEGRTESQRNYSNPDTAH